MGPRKYRRNFFFENFGGRCHYIVHDLGLTACLTARPAPRTTRPLAGLPNPYPYGCSVLCNHPRDPELKDVVWRPRISSNHEGSSTEHFDNAKAIKRTSRTGSATNGGAFVYHSHGWDKKMDGLETLVEVGADPLASAAQLAIRRCASGGPSPVERRSAKTEGMLVLDLRPWKSFDNVSSLTEAQHHDNFDTSERFELTSPRTRQEKPGRSRPIRRPETFPSKSFKEGKKMSKQLSRSRGMPPRNASDLGADQLDGNNVLSGYETNSLSGSIHDLDLEDGFSITKTEDGQSFREPKIDETFINGTDAQQIQACENPITTVQPTSLEDLEEHLRNVLVQEEHENDDESQMEEVIEDMTWLLFPRAGNTFGARFELPIDLRKLKTISSLDYLSQYVVATRCRQRLNDVVFDRHATSSMLPVEKLFLALAEILGFHLNSQAEEKLSELIELALIAELSREQFAGIGALAERIGRSGISRRDDLEVSDFNLLQQKMSYLQMDESLRCLFLFISENNPD